MNIKTLPTKLNRIPLIGGLGLALLIVLLSGSVALAHEQRVVGKYTFVVGFLNEPAYTDLPNSLDMRIMETQSGKPVDGLDKTLQAQVVFGASTMPLQLRARFGQEGAYLADVVPTKAGTYIFHITGNVQGQNVDEQFESGPNTFSDVEDLTDLQFPQKVPAELSLVTQIQAAQSAASTAQTFSIAAIVVALVIGGLSFIRRK